MAFNATPLFDMMFTLTIFFMLVCRLSSAEQVRMELPKPEESRARIAKMPERVVINCRYLPTDSTGRVGGVAYSLGPNSPEPLRVISERLAGMKVQSVDLEAVVRALLVDREDNVWIGRSHSDAPDVDAVVYVTGNDRKLSSGKIVACEIVTAQDYDLVAVAVGRPW